MMDSRTLEATKESYSLIRFFRKIYVFPNWQDACLSLSSAILLILSFPDFELWFLAWFALVPLFIAVERNKSSAVKNFWLGLLAGTVFFYGSCWWLAYAPINYGGIPAPIVYFLLVPATLGAGFFVGLFCSIFGHLVSKFGHFATFLAPIVWTACEFLRLLITGNAWNALGYSQAFQTNLISTAQFGGVFIVSFLIVLISAAITHLLLNLNRLALIILGLLLFSIYGLYNLAELKKFSQHAARDSVEVIAIQPDVPMSGLMIEDYYNLRQRHVEMTETALREIEKSEYGRTKPIIVVFPESPMNFAYAEDSEFREFLRDFTSRHKISLIFNAGEPDPLGDGYHNSAVMVNERGEKIAQYDKIRLVPFGEFVPEWLPGSQFLPTVVGRMKPGKDFRLMPFGSNIKAGIMICYESAFGDISNSFVRYGADVLVEITNDGYGGDTPILRQHLANAVFRAVETNRPVLRVTNVGITAYINERGEIMDATQTYTTATRIWWAEKSDGQETFYVRNGDLFAWVCTILTAMLLGLTFLSFRKVNNG